jgi:hypothetical protein
MNTLGVSRYSYRQAMLSENFVPGETATVAAWKEIGVTFQPAHLV